jgi:lipopolysaccharide transport system permease protein
MSDTSIEPTTRIIKPPRQWPGLGLAEMWRMRRVLLVLARRQFKARYSNMVLGVMWVLLEPLLLTLIITVFMGLLLDRGDRLGLPFPVFLFTAWTVWRPFSRVVNQGGSSIRGNAVLVERIYLPRAFLVLSVAIVSLVDLIFMVLALAVLLVFYGIAPGIGLLMTPVLLAIMYAFAVGGAFLSSAIGMSFPDMDFVRPLTVRAWFWLSPILYPSTAIPEEWRQLYYLNPMAVVIEGFRWAFTQTPMPPLDAWIIGASVAGVTLVGGYVYFRRREPLFSDLM